MKIKRSRIDCGSFTKDVIKIAEENGELFYLSAQRWAEFTTKIKAFEKWTEVTVGTKEVEVVSIGYKIFKEDQLYRYVVSREANKIGKLDHQCTVEG